MQQRKEFRKVAIDFAAATEREPDFHYQCYEMERVRITKIARVGLGPPHTEELTLNFTTITLVPLVDTSRIAVLIGLLLPAVQK